MTNNNYQPQDTSTFYRQKRIFYFDKEVTEESLSDITKQIIQCNMEDDEKEKDVEEFGGRYARRLITLYISSYGGSVYDVLSLIGVIKSSKTPVHTVAVGKVMSAGFVLLCAGHKRFAKPYTTFMFHSISSYTPNNRIQDLKENVEELERLQDILNDIVVQSSNIKLKKLESVVKDKKDWFFDTDKALEYKLIESVI